MRGGTSKGGFFHCHHLPQQRDALLLQPMGNPDPYAKQINGVGGATSGTSKISPATHEDCQVNYSKRTIKRCEGLAIL